MKTEWYYDGLRDPSDSVGKLLSHITKLEALLSDCQDWLCSGDGLYDEEQHAERMKRINTILLERTHEE